MNPKPKVIQNRKHTIERRVETYQQRRTASQVTSSLLTTNSSTTFHIQKLPFEVRVMIWQNTIEAQLVVVRGSPMMNLLNKLKVCHRFDRNNTIPVGLHVCHESRIQLLRYYTELSIENEHPGTFQTPGHHYVNFDIDTFVFPGQTIRQVEAAFKALGEYARKIQAMNFCLRRGKPQCLRVHPQSGCVYILVGGIDWHPSDWDERDLIDLGLDNDMYSINWDEHDLSLDKYSFTLNDEECTVDWAWDTMGWDWKIYMYLLTKHLSSGARRLPHT